MASAPQLTFSPLLSLSRNPTHNPQNFLHMSSKRSSFQIRAEKDPLGEFGARDPFPAEIESNFGDKVLGNMNTEHKILIPNASALSLSQQRCAPISQLQQPMSEDEAKKLLFKVVGWRLVAEEGGLKLRGFWKVRDVKCGEELINRITKAVECTGHLPDLHLEAPNQVRAELWTSSIGGLSMNDFIVAAKIDEIKISDLQPRQRVWA
ncbi:putative pterin-4-alpha-carbinolamine dehydratase [Phtheirospermum japonicum]|uniref:4a-hydroxytetrahydrobiopterin dehydratase n=1 Tax=Phtheirospermum japonicum TaxID=374723 RepID=A0A830C537_9LAMI|nr:putative pterin-4-alpha-carbinolamine dehydratase [Phtheirospermum japonicum]